MKSALLPLDAPESLAIEPPAFLSPSWKNLFSVLNIGSSDCSTLRFAAWRPRIAMRLVSYGHGSIERSKHRQQ